MTNIPPPFPFRAATKCLGLVALLLSFAGGVRGQIFTDWTVVDTTNKIATGTLGSTSITFTWTAGGDVNFSILDGSYTGYANAAFTPALATTDVLEFIGNTTGAIYTITFGVPVTNPILEFSSE